MKSKSFKLQLIFALILFWTLLALIFGYISYSVAEAENRASFPFVIFSLNFIKFYLWLAFLPVIFKIVRRFGFENRENFVFNLLIQAAFCFVFVVIHTVIYSPFVALIDPLIETNLPTINTLFEKYLFFGNFYLGVLLYSLLVIIIQAYLLFDKYQAEETLNSVLKAELADAQLQSLKMQLQPHFLFNTLHSISALNLSDPTKANAMIARLGDFLRMTLERSDEQMVTLNEELNFLRCYLEIEQIRFSDRLTVEFDVQNETLTAEIPHLILQPIVENAIKHGVSPYSGKGTIKISSSKSDGKLCLQITDSVAQKKSLAAQNGNGFNGKGLTNSRLRLIHLFHENFKLELIKQSDGTQVELQIPFKIADSISK